MRNFKTKNNAHSHGWLEPRNFHGKSRKIKLPGLVSDKKTIYICLLWAWTEFCNNTIRDWSTFFIMIKVWLKNQYQSRTQWMRGLRRGPMADHLLGLWVRILSATSMSVSCEVFCQVEVSGSGWSLVQKSPTERGVSECDREASIKRRLWSTAVEPWEGGNQNQLNGRTAILHLFVRSVPEPKAVEWRDAQLPCQRNYNILQTKYILQYYKPKRRLEKLKFSCAVSNLYKANTHKRTLSLFLFTL